MQMGNNVITKIFVTKNFVMQTKQLKISKSL